MDVMELAKRRGFFWPSFEIYGGTGGFYDYGPLGTLLKWNIIETWRKIFVIEEGFYEIDTPTVNPEEIFIASGHVDHFVEQMVRCKSCGEAYRVEDMLEELRISVDSFTSEETEEKLRNLKCPNCGGDFGKTEEFNTMFRTSIGPAGGKTGYLRPETAQGMFISFRRLSKIARGKLPFGIAQIGRAYRNEISPRQGVIRLREFNMAEVEIFFDPEENSTHPKFKEVENEKIRILPAENQEERKKGEEVEVTLREASERYFLNEFFSYYIWLTKRFLLEIGIPEKALRFRQQLDEERAHYSADTWDAEVKTERFGWVEVAGHAYRTDYDLKRHMEFSGEDLSVFVAFESPRELEKLKVYPRMERLRKKMKGQALGKLIEITKKENEKILRELNEKGELEFDGVRLTREDFEVKKEKERVTGKKVIPHVIEPSYGIDRPIYCILELNYLEEGERIYLRLPPKIAPIKCGVFPLVSKDGLPEVAKEVDSLLRKRGIYTYYDESGSIGRRYARMDEVGTPYCVTVDYQTLEDGTATLRYRDTKEQIRLRIEEIPSFILREMGVLC